MTTLQIENLPDELYRNIQQIAITKNYTLNETIIHLLQESLQSHEHSAQSTSEILQKIRSRPRINPIDFGFADSTVLICEDRNR